MPNDCSRPSRLSWILRGYASKTLCTSRTGSMPSRIHVCRNVMTHAMTSESHCGCRMIRSPSERFDELLLKSAAAVVGAVAPATVSWSLSSGDSVETVVNEDDDEEEDEDEDDDACSK